MFRLFFTSVLVVLVVACGGDSGGHDTPRLYVARKSAAAKEKLDSIIEP